MNNFVGKIKTKANHLAEIKKQRGMSLLEVIIVLGIIGTMAAIVVVLAQRAFTNKDITDLNDNTNSVRTAVVAAYESDGSYPAAAATAIGLTSSAIKTSKGATAPMVATLVNLGQISESEIKNGISGDYFTIQGVQVDKNAKGAPKAFVMAVNGLDQTECRSLLLQVGNQWDYVEIATAAAGVDPTFPATLDGAVVTTAAETGILRSLADKGQTTLTATSVVGNCAENANNAIILGSR